MRAMMASGMVPSAMAGRMRCRNASTSAFHCSVMQDVQRVDVGEEVEEGSRQALEVLQAPRLDQRDSTGRPGLGRPEAAGRRAVSLEHDREDVLAATRPSTKTGMETPRLAHAIVPDVGRGVAPRWPR